MRLRFWTATALTALALMVPRVYAEPVELGSDYDQSEAPAASDSVAAGYAEATEAPPVPEATAADAPAAQGSEQCTCGTCQDCCGCKPCGPYSEPCPKFNAYFYSGVDSFRGISNGSFPNSNGVVNGLNFGGALLEDRGIGWQFGGSYNMYNLNGNSTSLSQFSESTQQLFLTTGIFRRANSNRRFSWGVVHDWMIVDNFGVFGSSFTLSQWRGQAAWALGPKNEVGLWATIEDRFVSRTFAAPGIAPSPLLYQAIDQGNLFWHHKFNQFGADSWFYAGIPLNGRLATAGNSAGFPAGGFGGSLGSALVGTNWLIPINDRFAAYMNAMYMKPSAHRGGTAVPTSTNLVPGAMYQEFWNISFGISVYLGRAARSATVAGREWMPYMPVANNSNFLVDTNKTL